MMSSDIKKPGGLDIVIGVGKPKRPELPSRMFGGKQPEAETETSEQQSAEDDRASRSESRLDRMERLLEKLAEAMGVDVEKDEGAGDNPDEEAKEYGD
jgi:hypothetical protein